MASKPPATIYDILQLQPGTKDSPTWVNDEFEAAVSGLKSGPKSTSAVLSDPHNPNVQITAVFWDKRDLSRFNGCVCHFAGQGMKRDEYQGTQQVSMSAKTTVNIVGRATNTGGQSAPQGGGQSRPAGSSPAPSSAPGVIHGATVGMAINQANGIIISGTSGMNPQEREQFFDSPAYSKTLWTIASDIVRIARVMEAGKLAPAAKDRADPNFAAKQKEAADKAEADRKAAEEAEKKRQEEEAKKAAAQSGGSSGSQGNLDEDVPF
jgi:hypothetical protein